MVALALAWLLTGGWAARAAAQAPVKVRVGYGTAPADITPLIWQKRDILKHYGKSYTVELTHFQGTSAQMQAFAAKALDLGTLSYISFATAILKTKADLKIVADLHVDGYQEYFTMKWAVPEDSPIRSAKDLKGKTVSVNIIGGGLDIPLRVMLKRQGLEDKRDYTIVEVNFPNSEAMLREKKVDAAVFLAPFWYRAIQKGGIRPIFTSKDAVGPTQMIMKVAESGFLAKHPQVARDIFEDWQIALRWYLNVANRAEAVKVIADFTKVPAAVHEAYVFTTKDLYRDPQGIPNVAVIQANFDLLHELGYAGEKLDVRKYLDLTYIKP
jgi:NitT/TauT family transport system substrate-binding protein